MAEVMQVYDTVKKEYVSLTVENGILPVPGTWDYGTYPQNAYLDINGIIAALSTTAADLFVSNDISIYDSVAFEIYAISGTTPAIKIVPSYDGTNYSATPLAITDLSSGALTTAIAGGTGAIAIGNYMVAIPAKARKIKMLFTASVVGGASMRGAIWKR